METKKKRRKAQVDSAVCVACGCCVKVCPLGAIEVVRGVAARVDAGKCVAECPASVIALQEVQA